MRLQCSWLFILCIAWYQQSTLTVVLSLSLLALQDGNVVGLVSQSRVLEFLHKNMGKFPNSGVTVDSFWKPGSQPLVSVPITEDAIFAFKQMFDFVSGVPHRTRRSHHPH
jgi:hypothetical protein